MSSYNSQELLFDSGWYILRSKADFISSNWSYLLENIEMLKKGMFIKGLVLFLIEKLSVESFENMLPFVFCVKFSLSISILKSFQAKEIRLLSTLGTMFLRVLLRLSMFSFLFNFGIEN